MSSNDHKKLSIIIACYNEEKNILPMYERLIKTLGSSGYSLEIIYVDNNSADNSENIYRNLAKKDTRVKAILMSRNFGSGQPSYFAGLEYCAGDAAILIDGDLQDPPEVIPEFIKKWEEDYEVVYGVRKKRKGGNFLKRFLYKLFYRIFKKLAYIDIPLDAGEFGLIDRQAINELIKFPENDVLVRGLRAFVGFRQIGVEYVRESRIAGESTTNFFADLKWAKRFIINFSNKPLEWISYLAFIIFLIAVFGLILNLVLYIINPEVPSGMPTLIFGFLLFGAVQMLALSIIGEYLANVFREAKNRPRYIIREILNDKK